MVEINAEEVTELNIVDAKKRFITKKLGPKARKKEAVAESICFFAVARYGNRGTGQQKKTDHGGGFCEVRDGMS